MQFSLVFEVGLCRVVFVRCSAGHKLAKVEGLFSPLLGREGC